MFVKDVKEEKYEMELCGTREENERESERLDALFKQPQDVTNTAGV